VYKKEKNLFMAHAELILFGTRCSLSCKYAGSDSATQVVSKIKNISHKEYQVNNEAFENQSLFLCLRCFFV
jgi:hypothetical protein